ncbi:unnamed protein product [Polarella glacialis]|uniref:Uncharacterized protein n=1 Tax=Polarella glacialis TaxID=89957 RepID=A0A813LXW8_POLGL|nr:unnamed protein product [Polarella glacialis]
MGSVGPLSSPGTIVAITVAYVLVSTHVWIARAQIANQLKSWGRDYPKKITELVLRIILQMPSSRQSKSKSARSSRREKRMKEAAKLQQAAFERSRVAACSSFLISVCPWVALVLFIRVSLLLVLGVPVNESLAVIIPLYSLTLLPAAAVFGLVFANTKLTALCNIPIFCANIYRLREASNIFRTTAGGEQDPDYLTLAIVSEGICCMGIVCLASVIPKLFQEKMTDAMVCNMRNPSEPPSHLIGIREQPSGHEISTSFQRPGSISEVGEAHVAAPGAAEPPTQVLSDLLLKKATGSRSSQASSASGSSTQGSRAVQQPSIQHIEFQFDGMADGFPLQHAKIYFDSPATTESSTSPMMKDWLLESMWPRFRVWVQNAINEGMAGRGDTFNPTESAVALLWPGQADTVLCADEVQFHVEVLEETEDLQAKKQKTSQASPYTESTEQAEEADEEAEEVKSVAIWATMHGFHQHRNPEKKRSSRTDNRSIRLQHSLQSKSMTDGCSGLLTTTCLRTSQDSQVASKPNNNNNDNNENNNNKDNNMNMNNNNNQQQ